MRYLEFSKTDFERQTNPLISNRGLNMVSSTRKKNVDFTGLVDHSENKRKRKDRQILKPCQRTKKKTVKQVGDSCASCTYIFQAQNKTIIIIIIIQDKKFTAHSLMLIFEWESIWFWYSPKLYWQSQPIFNQEIELCRAAPLLRRVLSMRAEK